MPEVTNLYVVLVSADAEWRTVRSIYAESRIEASPFGGHFDMSMVVDGEEKQLRFMQGGWGKVAAAASSQYAIDHWKPSLLINIGTCGGVGQTLQRGDIVLPNKTIIYDIFEQMGDADEAITAFTTEIDTSWTADLIGKDVHSGPLVSADRDVIQGDLAQLREKYQAIAADWESGSIAWVAHRNQTPIIILRGVSDLVSETEAPAYGDPQHFEKGTQLCMKKIILRLPQFLSAWNAQ